MDIDSQAVEVTKLSLLLKVLEGESDETLKRQLSFVHERALPDLGQNIKCGNFLSRPDYFAGQLMPDEDEMRRVNPFDWQAEFPEIMEGGLRCGHRQSAVCAAGIPVVFKDYLAQRYVGYDGLPILYAYFMEKSIKLLREGGRFSFIVSSSFLRTTYGEALRRTLKKQAAVLRILDFGGQEPCSRTRKIPMSAYRSWRKPNSLHVSSFRASLHRPSRSLDDSAIDHRFMIPQERLSQEAWSLKSDQEAAVFDKVMKVGPLGEYVERKFFRGLLTGLNEAFELNQSQREDIVRGARESEALIKPFLGGQDIRRYEIEDGGRFLIVIPSTWTQTVMAKEKKIVGQVSEREAWIWFAGCDASQTCQAS